MSKSQKVTAALLPTLVVLSLSLFVAALALIFLYVQADNKIDSSSAGESANINVSVGVYEYEFSEGKATKISRETVSKLKEALFDKVESNLKHDSNCINPTYIVNVMNGSMTQALVKYGCDGPNSPMHAKYVDGEWDFISPTNKFDNFTIPLCDYVEENNLDQDVAPVCYRQEDDRKMYVSL